jgi:2-polyprenyl-3-methyl-5-hydroxy-6-metoxy-1,4-benzoquinol methylase
VDVEPLSRVKLAVASARRRQQSSRRWLDRFFGAEYDPYHAEDNPYEDSKFADLLGALDGRRYDRGLEVGCAIGTFTERLASSCGQLLAIDIAEPAVARTRARLSSQAHVRVEQRTVPAGLPAGPFDLIVCSDVLYYLPARPLRRTLHSLAAMTAPGGTILSLHWLGDFGAPSSGDQVHDLQRQLWTDLEHVLERHRSGVGPQAAGYRLDRYDRPDDD